MGALHSFLAKLKASPRVQEAMAAGSVLKGECRGVRFNQTAAESLADLDRLVEHVETADTELALTVHDKACKIVARDAPLRERLMEFLELLKAHDPRPRKQ
jgi:hypothetical protein